MKNTSKSKADFKDKAMVATVVISCITGIIGSIVYCNEPYISLLFRPGILYALAIAWGLYLGFTYRQ